jgi:hypothetical protein
MPDIQRRVKAHIEAADTRPICEHPEMHPRVDMRLRRAALHRFPYGVYCKRSVSSPSFTGHVTRHVRPAPTFREPRGAGKGEPPFSGEVSRRVSRAPLSAMRSSTLLRFSRAASPASWSSVAVLDLESPHRVRDLRVSGQSEGCRLPNMEPLQEDSVCAGSGRPASGSFRISPTKGLDLHSQSKHSLW